MTATKNWERAHQATKAKYRVGGRSEAEARHLYESGEPPPPARQPKTQRKAEVKAELARREPAEIGPPGPDDTDQDWADRINAAERRLQATTEDMKAAIFQLGGVLHAAQQNLPHGSWSPMVEQKTPLSLRSAERYVRIFEALSKSPHVASLPPYVGTLDVLASWKPNALEAAVTKGDVTPELERTKAKELSEEYGPPKAITARPAQPSQAATEPATPPPGPPAGYKPQQRGSGTGPATTAPDEQDHPAADADDGVELLTNKSGDVLPITRSHDGTPLVGNRFPEHTDADRFVSGPTRAALIDQNVKSTIAVLESFADTLADFPEDQHYFEPLKPALVGLLKLLVGEA